MTYGVVSVNDMETTRFTRTLYEELPFVARGQLPWQIIASIHSLLSDAIRELATTAFDINNGVAIHKSASVSDKATILAPAIVESNCIVGPGAFLRGGVYMGVGAVVGFCCEIKCSILLSGAAASHLNYIGDSIIGSNVNIEAGACVVNYHNDTGETINVLISGQVINTGVSKFGALVGDGTLIGANSVLAPGSILEPNSQVERLQCIDQSMRGLRRISQVSTLQE